MRKTAVGIVLVAILFSAFLLIRPIAAEELGYQNISVQQARKMIKHDSGNLVILDVRNQSEYNLGHLYEAILIPVYEIENRTISQNLPQPPANDSLMRSIYERVNSGFQLQAHVNDKIIVYCQAGSRSALACQILVAHGFTKVYNMIGGIIAWMQANYPIYTNYHHATVDFANHDKEILIDIEPWLLYQSSCTSCQSQTCSGSITPANTTETVLEKSENHTVLLITGEVNSTAFEYTVDKTLLWHYNYSRSGFNRTIEFVSTIITGEGNSTHLFSLSDYVQHEDYNLTVGTILYPLDSETYNRSLTTVEYVPSGEKGITTAERVDFNTSVTLSQLYASLSKVISKLGKTYERSEDTSLTVFAERYYTMADETKLLSILVKTQIPEYDENILNSTATIMDINWCDVCSIVCGVVILIGAAVCYFIVSAACTFYLAYMSDIYKYGCPFLCAIICSGQSNVPPFWMSSITFTGGYGSYAVDNPGNILGCSRDGNYAHLHACNYGDEAMIIGYMNADSQGHIYIYGYSGAGYYSDLYVYVSPDNSNWYYVNSLRITANSPYSIDVGTYSSNFRYIAICGYDSSCSVCLYLDAVSVIP